MIKLSIKLGILMFAGIAAGVLWQQSQLAVIALSRIDPLPDTRTMIADERYAEAADYLGFFMNYEYVNQDPEAQALYREISNKRAGVRYQAKKLVEGLLVGTSDESIGQAAGVITDFFLIGDLRDLAVQGSNLAQGEEVDEVLVALASFGVIATGAQIASGAGTVATGGAAAPAIAGSSAAKSGMVVLKTARKLGKLPPWVGKTIVQSAKAVKETQSLRALTSLFGNVGVLAKTPGGFSLLSKTKDVASLERMAAFVEIFGANSATLYRIGGNLIVKSAKQAGSLGKDTVQLAATFGQGGLRVLDKFGAVKFVKFSSRASKMAHKGDIFKLIASLLLRIPNWILYILVLLGGLVWIPSRAKEITGLSSVNG